jgi:hypothetical protein
MDSLPYDIWYQTWSHKEGKMEFTPSLADPDVWIRAACKENGYSYYEYLLVYVDDILILSHNPTPILTCIQKFYRLKEPASVPKTYLGHISNHGLFQGTHGVSGAWAHHITQKKL